MSKTFELKDDSVVVVIGSGAGGGTLSNELTQRGASVVCLEAGPRLTLSDIVNDNATMFGRSGAFFMLLAQRYISTAVEARADRVLRPCLEQRPYHCARGGDHHAN
jgi:choline dehydrogenase-like flavoprotein